MIGNQAAALLLSLIAVSVILGMVFWERLIRPAQLLGKVGKGLFSLYIIFMMLMIASLLARAVGYVLLFLFQKFTIISVAWAFAFFAAGVFGLYRWAMLLLPNAKTDANRPAREGAALIGAILLQIVNLFTVDLIMDYSGAYRFLYPYGVKYDLIRGLENGVDWILVPVIIAWPAYPPIAMAIGRLASTHWSRRREGKEGRLPNA